MNTQTFHATGKKSVKGILTEGYRFFKAAPFAIAIIWRFEPKLLLILFASTTVEGFLPVVSVWIMRYLLDAIVDAYHHPGDAAFMKKACYVLIFQVAVTAGSACVGKLISFYKTLLSSKLSIDMQSRLLEDLSQLGMKDYDDPETYNMITRAKNEAQSNKPLSVVSGICDVISSLITCLSFSISLFSLSPAMVVAMFIICVPYFVLNVYFAKANFNLQFDQIHDQRASSYLDACFTNRRYLPEIITLGLSPYLRKRWNAIGTGLISQNMALLKRRNKSELVMIVFVFLGKGGISLYIIVRCLQYASFYTVGQIMMYIQSFSGGINALAGVMQQLSGIYEGSCFLQNYQRFIEVKKTSNCASIPKLQVPEEIESFECRGVGFIYPGSSTCALENINLTFKKGESTLLIGRNGAGKTTLARLLVGLYVPTTGQILVNGHDMREYDLPLLRKKISMLFQDFVRYALTAGENIGVGCIEHIGDRRRVVSAAKAARVEEIIGRLPNGYGTMLGKEFRGGQDLSLGEWQRLCLARLFMREASLIVYDEPTASLDVETESDLLREIALSAKSRICILVSHRMLRSDIANRIVVLENGRIVEIGNHDQLVTCGGRYAHLWHLYHRLGSDNGDCGAD